VCCVAEGPADVSITRPAASSVWPAEVPWTACSHRPASRQVWAHSWTGFSCVWLSSFH